MANLASPDFQRAFAAISYMAGRRDAELLEPLSFIQHETRVFVRHLSHPERERRAEILARELSRLVIALEARTLK